MANPRPQLKCKTLTVELDHNPYEVSFYNLKKDRSHKVIIFPLFHYDGFRQFYDLLAPIINEGHRLVVVKLLAKKDRVLFSSYYVSIFKRILTSLKDDKLIANKINEVDNINKYIVSLIVEDIYRNRKYNFINNEITIDFAVSRKMQYLIDEAEKADILNNYGLYMNIADAIDVQAKKETTHHIIRESEWKKLTRRYCL